MANQYINKVIYGGKTLIDLSGDTVSADKLLKGLTAHDKSGAVITGTCTFDVDSGDADVAVAEILEGKIAYARGAKVTGTMPNKGAVTGVIAAVADSFTIPLGYHDGSGSVAIKAEEQAKLVAANIREGVTILGVEGTMSGSENMKPQAKTVTPSTSTAQQVLPDEGYNLSVAGDSEQDSVHRERQRCRRQDRHHRLRRTTEWATTRSSTEARSLWI